LWYVSLYELIRHTVDSLDDGVDRRCVMTEVIRRGRAVGGRGDGKVSTAVSVMALQAQVDELTAERDTLVAENQRLAVYLDDCLDFAQLHALDPANERIAVAAVRAHAKHLDEQYHW
jgi:hypothetical protein